MNKEMFENVTKFTKRYSKEILVGLSAAAFLSVMQTGACAAENLKEKQTGKVIYEKPKQRVDDKIKDAHHEKRKVKKYADIYDADIEWMPKVYEKQIYEAYAEYKEFGV